MYHISVISGISNGSGSSISSSSNGSTVSSSGGAAFGVDGLYCSQAAQKNLINRYTALFTSCWCTMCFYCVLWGVWFHVTLHYSGITPSLVLRNLWVMSAPIVTYEQLHLMAGIIPLLSPTSVWEHSKAVFVWNKLPDVFLSFPLLPHLVSFFSFFLVIAHFVLLLFLVLFFSPSSSCSYENTSCFCWLQPIYTEHWFCDGQKTFFLSFPLFASFAWSHSFLSLHVFPFPSLLCSLSLFCLFLILPLFSPFIITSWEKQWSLLAPSQSKHWYPASPPTALSFHWQLSITKHTL